MFLLNKYGEEVKTVIPNWSVKGGRSAGKGSINVGILIHGVYKEFEI